MNDRNKTLSDRIYQQRRDSIADFEFDESVVSVFPDMISRSIPGYQTIIELSGMLSASKLPVGGRCYDLGCSLGATTLAILHAVGTRNCEIIAVDSSQPMIDKARTLIDDQRVRFECADIQTMPLENAHVVTLNFVLQFLPRDTRESFLRGIHSSLLPEGLLVLSEKVESDQEFEKLHLEFKKIQGYSNLEIAQKRTALENVMKIDSIDSHLARLERAGFRNSRVWFRCLNWISIIAGK